MDPQLQGVIVGAVLGIAGALLGTVISHRLAIARERERRDFEIAVANIQRERETILKPETVQEAVAGGVRVGSGSGGGGGGRGKAIPQ